MENLKLMGGFCFLKCESMRKSLMECSPLTVEDADHVNEIQINGFRISYEHFPNLLRMDPYAHNIERCHDLKDFLILTKLDFEQE